HAGRRGLGASEERSAAPAARAPDGPPESEAERESAHAGRRGLGASEERSAAPAARAPDGPPESEAERESAHAGRRGLGASEERSAAPAARAPDGPQNRRPSARALTPADGVWGHRRSGARRQPREHRTGPQNLLTPA